MAIVTEVIKKGVVIEISQCLLLGRGGDFLKEPAGDFLGVWQCAVSYCGCGLHKRMDLSKPVGGSLRSEHFVVCKLYFNRKKRNGRFIISTNLSGV